MVINRKHRTTNLLFALQDQRIELVLLGLRLREIGDRLFGHSCLHDFFPEAQHAQTELVVLRSRRTQFLIEIVRIERTARPGDAVQM